jgi:uncharacterized membrane-anchored protein
MRAGLAVAVCLCFACGPLAAQETVDPETGGPAAAEEEVSPLARLEWILGPSDVKVGTHATLTVPEGFMYLHRSETSKFQEIVENPSNGRQSLIAPDDLRWFGLFEFDDIGYVKDDEEIDADQVLKSVRESTEQANEERKNRGWAPLLITGWHFKPRYDSTTQRLEWAIAGESEGEPMVNVNTRLLGRKGVTSATLVAGPETLDADFVEFKGVLGGFQYVTGEGYADVQEGDHMAEYGLAALIAGGGAAVAAKSGLLKGLWKFIVIGVAGVGAWLVKLFKGKKQQDA